MKIIFALVIIFACGYVGFGLSHYYKKRKNFFEKCIEGFSFIKTEIVFNHKKISEVFLTLQKTDCAELSSMCLNFQKYIADKTLALDEKLLFSGNYILKKNEKTLLLNFFKSVGRFDELGEEKHFDNYVNCLKAKQKESDEIYNKFGKILGKLGILLGCAIALILL